MTNQFRAVLVAAGLAATGLSGAVGAACDADAGEKVYNKCAACHSLEPGVQLMGPSLYGLLGKTAGSEPGFVYSAAMEESGLVWDDATLDAFLAAPMSFLPGTTMPFGGLKSTKQRAALLCFFQQQSH